MAQNNEDLLLKFGYTEMYEWSEVPENKLGIFVQFDKKSPGKIVPYKYTDEPIIGITTICSQVNSDDPDDWKYRYLFNEVGDLYLKKEKLAVGNKEYDQLKEITYIKTYPWEHLVRIDRKEFDKEVKYVKRTNRVEWIRVNLLGKCIVYDDGTCEVGDYCKPSTSKIKSKQGIATKASKEDINKYYVLQRISSNSILILNK